MNKLYLFQFEVLKYKYFSNTAFATVCTLLQILRYHSYRSQEAVLNLNEKHCVSITSKIWLMLFKQIIDKDW
jgi:hypothetical protein